MVKHINVSSENLNLAVNEANQKANIYTMFISVYVVKILIRLIMLRLIVPVTRSNNSNIINLNHKSYFIL